MIDRRRKHVPIARHPALPHVVEVRHAAPGKWHVSGRYEDRARAVDELRRLMSINGASGVRVRPCPGELARLRKREDDAEIEAGR